MTERCPTSSWGDDASPLGTYLMKRHRRVLGDEMMVTKYCISRGRSMVKNACGILANLWKCFLGTKEHCPDTTLLIVENAIGIVMVVL